MGDAVLTLRGTQTIQLSFEAIGHRKERGCTRYAVKTKKKDAKKTKEKVNGKKRDKGVIKVSRW